LSDEADLDAYLRRINYAGSIAPSLATLEMVHKLHPSVIPFENLDPLMELPVRLQLSDIEQKLLREGRGGYCFEHNLLLKAALEAMDYKVTPMAAVVLWGREPDDAPDQPTHMVLVVEVDGMQYLADVGFGGQVLTAPLRLRADTEQTTPNGRFRLVGGAPLWRLESQIGEDWRALYEFDLTPRTLDDYIAMNDVVMARFRNDLIAARVEDSKRFALRNARLRTYENGETTTRQLATLLEIRDVLENVFGITLPASDRLDPALEKALRPGAND
jgi:N-hydroxyarylamine O-acetyltransferase